MNDYYYLGANTPTGFYSYYNELDKCAKTRKYIIKGGPGTGKSSFMKKIGKAYEDAGEAVDYILCSSDPNSLDGVILKNLGTAFVDGTAPHTVDPEIPGAYDEIINLGDFWNKKKLYEHKEEIQSLQSDIKSHFDSAYRALAASEKIQEDIFSVLSRGTDFARMKKLTERIIKAEFKKKDDKPTPGECKCRFASGITPLGINFLLGENLEGLRVYNIRDPYKTGGVILSKIAEFAISRGHNVIKYFCPLSPNESPEHIVIEDLDLAFVTSNGYHEYKGIPFRTINLERYTSLEIKKEHRAKLKFLMKLKRVLIKDALHSVSSAKALHDELEEFYKSAMDFTRLNKFTKSTLSKLIV